MSLNKKTLTELRGIAQNMGLIPRYDVGREQLLQDISMYVAAKVAPPEKPIQINILQGSDTGVLRQDDILHALRGFIELGVNISFPDEHTWMMECNGRQDTGTMSMGMWNVIQCARDIVKR